MGSIDNKITVGKGTIYHLRTTDRTETLRSTEHCAVQLQACTIATANEGDCNCTYGVESGEEKGHFRPRPQPETPYGLATTASLHCARPNKIESQAAGLGLLELSTPPAEGRGFGPLLQIRWFSILLLAPYGTECSPLRTSRVVVGWES